MEFVRRISQPSKDNKYYLKKPKGYNFDIKIIGDECIPNCTGYAIGRFMEEQNIKTCNLPPANINAENWLEWVQNHKAYRTGKTPKLGAIAVWSKGKKWYDPDGMGHVAMVEYVAPDGSWDSSESAYKGKRWYTKHYNANSYRAGYKFEGFIYPDVDFTDGSELTPGNYELIKEKYYRTSPKVINGSKPNKYPYSKLTTNAKKQSTKDNKGFARYKIGAKVNVKEIKKNSDGTYWARTNQLWFCIYDKTGYQAKKVI